MPLNYTNKISAFDEIEDSTLVQLVYVSTLTLGSRLNTSIFDEVENHARNYNQQHGITGTLCYGNGHFLQCIEGEKAHVFELQQRIFADSRHKNIEVLLLQTIDNRSFADWRMRLLFLERWLWSPASKKQAAQLSAYLPFFPHDWSPEHTAHFLQIIKTFEHPPHIQAAGITYNAMGNMFRHIVAPHQAFLIVQGFLSILLIVGLILLYYW
ncbi:BLUF domain-containing protein [Psychrobacter immobilis]|uniref:BLUF domain-containing protein n=1 Tax=Psychrobacter immobilis TaxID=498 RepID=UPI00191A78F6|nr:BLUF domain-containing protein [Psychrobacter immobilis]